MDVRRRWNHVNFAVPPERMPLLEECLDTLFPWEKFVSKPYLLGYLPSDDPDGAALYFRPLGAAGPLDVALERLRAADEDLDVALGGLEGATGEGDAHTGFVVASVAEWEARLAAARRAERERPELQVSVVDVVRSAGLCRAFIRIGLLEPMRHTFEMQVRCA